MTHHIQLTFIVSALASLVAPILGSAVAQVNPDQMSVGQFDLPTLKLVSDDDLQVMQEIRAHIDREFYPLKSVDEVHILLEKVKTLAQKHPKNVAFAGGDLRELHKFLSLEIVGRLVRVDADPFILPISDERMPLAKRAIEDDDLVKKLFSRPLSSLIESRKQQLSRSDSSNHRDGNFFANFWCKISGTCSN